METFLKIFNTDGRNEKCLENEINDFARNRNLEIVSASPCFRKGFIDHDLMFIAVVFRKIVKNEVTEDETN